ncbi:MAG: class I SAM-dependent methyltransferase [Rubrobacteraceae bacterium]
MPGSRERTLTVEEARAFYDGFGARQDRQGFYEDRALAILAEHAGFERAGAVLEFGCGTGRFAGRMMSEMLPVEACYLGLDISTTMVGLARERLRRWPERAEVVLSDGSNVLPVPDDGFDRFVSSYVFDLLGEQDIRATLEEADRVLSADGRLSLVSLTYGEGVLPGLVSSVWKQVHGLRPRLVGGCRPVRLTRFLSPNRWRILHREIVTSFGVSSEVLVASRSGER